jgi:hypothetical protein
MTDDISELFANGTKLRDALPWSVMGHAPIAHPFDTGIGHRFMFIESSITALPLHDSVLVAAVGGWGSKGDHGGCV